MKGHSCVDVSATAAQTVFDSSLRPDGCMQRFVVRGRLRLESKLLYKSMCVLLTFICIKFFLCVQHFAKLAISRVLTGVRSDITWF